MSGLVLICAPLLGGRLRSGAGAGAGAGDSSSGGRFTGVGRTDWRSSTLLDGVVVASEDGEDVVWEPKVVVLLKSPSETSVVLDTPCEPRVKGFCVKLGLVVLGVNPLGIFYFTGA